MKKEKVKGVTNWPMPQCVKNIQKFLGLTNYYWQFVKDFAKIAKPLHQLVRKDEKWKWGKEQEEVFTKLKEIFMTELTNNNHSDVVTMRRQLYLPDKQ